MTTAERIAKHLRQLAPHVRARDSAQLLEDALYEIDSLNADREFLMRRLFRAGEVFAQIEAHPEQAERLAREAQFGPDAAPLTHNAALRGDSGLIAGVPLESTVRGENPGKD